jgi:hypothetical protein
MNEYDGKILLKDWLLDKQVRNTANNDKLLDWLALYGEGITLTSASTSSTYVVKPDTSLSTYQASLEFSLWIREQKKLFFPMCIDYMLKKLGLTEFKAENGEIFPSPAIQILDNTRDADRVTKYNDTLTAMRLGFPIIVKGLLHDEKNKMVCFPDILVRRDLLSSFFNNFQSNLPLTDATDTSGTGKLKYEYDIIHVRYAYLELSRKHYPELLGSSKNGKYYEALLNAQARALTNATGQKCLEAYIIGRGWKCGKTLRNDHVFDMLGTVCCNQDSNGYETLIKASKWLKKLMTEGKNWQIYPKPSHKDLYPNMKNTCDFPWSTAKHNLAVHLKELTLLWQVGPVHRNLCLLRGVSEYDDPRLSTDMMSMPKGKNSSRLARIILANQRRTAPLATLPSSVLIPAFISLKPSSTTTTKSQTGASPVLPEKFQTRQKNILQLSDNIEWSTDFETKSSIDDPLTTFPVSMDTTMIAMIGCGYEHPIKGTWIPKIFSVEHLTKTEEARIIDEWLAYMTDVQEQYRYVWSKDKKNRLNKGTKGTKALKVSNETKGEKRKLRQTDDTDKEEKVSPKSHEIHKMFHWSKAEQSFLETNYNSAIIRHNREDWRENIKWCDVHQLCKDENLTIPGCFNFGLKSVAKALYKWNCIDDIWLPSPVENGMSATIALLRCGEDAVKNNRKMSDSIWMKELRPYLKLDIYTVYSIVKYFRKRHL